MGSMLANMRKRQQKEALESYKKLQKEDGGGGVTDPFKFAVRPDADTAQLALDVRAHHELTNRGQLRIAAESGLVEVCSAAHRNATRRICNTTKLDATQTNATKRNEARNNST